MKYQQTVVVLSVVLASLLATEVNAEVVRNRFRNTLTGADKCLDIINDGENNKLTMATCGNFAGQRWSITANKTSPKNYQLQTPFAGADKCLEVMNDGENNKLTMATCSDAPGQLWSITANRTNPGYSGYSRVRSQLTGAEKCLDIINDGRNNKLTMATCAKIAGQNWRITRTP
jgi:sortase (surface protein transpeptidase)